MSSNVAPIAVNEHAGTEVGFYATPFGNLWHTPPVPLEVHPPMAQRVSCPYIPSSDLSKGWRPITFSVRVEFALSDRSLGPSCALVSSCDPANESVHVRWQRRP